MEIINAAKILEQNSEAALTHLLRYLKQHLYTLEGVVSSFDIKDGSVYIKWPNGDYEKFFEGEECDAVEKIITLLHIQKLNFTSDTKLEELREG